MVDLGPQSESCANCGMEKGHSGPCIVDAGRAYVVGEAYFTSREAVPLISPENVQFWTGKGRITTINENLFRQVLLDHPIRLRTDEWHQPQIVGCACGWNIPATSSMLFVSWVEHVIERTHAEPLRL